MRIDITDLSVDRVLGVRSEIEWGTHANSRTKILSDPTLNRFFESIIILHRIRSQ